MPYISPCCCTIDLSVPKVILKQTKVGFLGESARGGSFPAERSLLSQYLTKKKGIHMANFRIDRISEEVRHALDAIIREMNDPRISGTYCITRADVTRDLRFAKVYVSVLEDEKADDMLKALKKAAGFIRRELGFRVDLRYTPELIFERDRNIAYGVHIAEVLKQVAPKAEDTEEE